MGSAIHSRVTQETHVHNPPTYLSSVPSAVMVQVPGLLVGYVRHRLMSGPLRSVLRRALHEARTSVREGAAEGTHGR